MLTVYQSQPPVIDLVVLSRDASPLHELVQRAIDSQKGVRLKVHRVFGKRLAGDVNRWAVIARARNEGKRRGTSDWAMFADDDVVLAPDCVRRLFEGLQARKEFGALAADYLGESHGRICTSHVAMGAVLFRRGALDRITFRWSPGSCECLCCCRDMRRQRLGIGYLPEARARHIRLTPGKRHDHAPAKAVEPISTRVHQGIPSSGQGYILTAFNRRHYHRFMERFIPSLRRAGNRERVLALASGLHPSECRTIERLSGVKLIRLSTNSTPVARRRLLEFQRALRRLPTEAMVAYWDAGDVIFQDRVADLWKLIGGNPDRLLVVAEPKGYPENRAVAKWTQSIADPLHRQRAFELLSQRPFLNGGFAAGTVAVMRRYLEGAYRLRNSVALRGTINSGDQTAMNIYCHSDPSRFLAVDDRWNYCLFGRDPKSFRIAGGKFVRRNGGPIAVVHGNAGTLAPFASRRRPLVGVRANSGRRVV